MWPLYNRAHHDLNDDITPGVRFALEGIREIHRQCKPRYVWPIANNIPTATLILDARGTVNGEWGSEFLGGLLILGSIKEYFMVPVTSWGISEKMGQGKVRINEAETVNVLVALCTWRRYLRCLRVNVWVDSSTTQGAITNGYSKSSVLTKMAGEVWLILS